MLRHGGWTPLPAPQADTDAEAQRTMNLLFIYMFRFFFCPQMLVVSILSVKNFDS